MKGGDGGRRGISIAPPPYIGMGITIPMGIPCIGIPFMPMPHIGCIGIGGMARELREPAASETMEARRLPVPLMRRSRRRMSCCDEDATGDPEYIDGGREDPGMFAEP